MIPGSNLLKMAFRLIAQQAFDYYAFAGRITSEYGLLISTYEMPVAFSGSVQPVPRNLYMNNGLDFQKNYVTFFLPKNAIDIDRDVSGDLFFFNGGTYQCLSRTNWFSQDGWEAMLAVEIQNVPLISIVMPPADGDYDTGDALNFTVLYNMPVAVTGAPRIALTIGDATRYAAYVSGSGTSSLLFRYTVASDDAAPSGISCLPYIDLNDGSLAGVATNAPAANIGFVAPDLTGVTVNA